MIDVTTDAVQRILNAAFVYDVTNSDISLLIAGETIWARIKGESSHIHLIGSDIQSLRVVIGRSR